MDTTTLLIILVILFVLGGGYYGRGRWSKFRPLPPGRAIIVNRFVVRPSRTFGGQGLSSRRAVS